ncbi:MAG: DUF4286 family protein [Bacteroidota bacterium]
MITYQVSLTIQKEVEKEWLDWMKTVHVPDVIATGLVLSFRILKAQGTEQVYIFQYDFKSQESYDKYQQEHSPALRLDTQNHFPGKYTSERATLDWL